MESPCHHERRNCSDEYAIEGEDIIVNVFGVRDARVRPVDGFGSFAGQRSWLLDKEL